MEKIRISYKDAKKVCDNLYQLDYFASNFLLDCEQPIFYGCGNSGWNCDYYMFEFAGMGKILVCTGYRTIGKKIKSDITKKAIADAKKESFFRFENEDYSTALKNYKRGIIKRMIEENEM